MQPTPINAIHLSQLFAARTGISYCPRNIRNKLLRRTTRRCPVRTLPASVATYRKNAVAWPLERYIEIEAFLLGRSPSELPPLSQNDLLFIEALGLVTEAAEDISSATADVTDMRRALQHAA